MSSHEPGSVIAGKYRLIRRVGIGGMGEVFLARAEGVAGFEKSVALKLIHDHLTSESWVMEMFLAEARLSAQLSHANIAQLFDLGQSGNSYYIAMEYVPGLDLRALMTMAAKRNELLPLPLCVHVLAKLCQALDYAHRKKDSSGRRMKLVHRDISPANCIISFSGEVKLIDFGIAKAASEANRTRTGIIKGKTAYMSPEQVQGLPLDRRSDIFSMGILLYELLCGVRPFEAESEVAILESIRDCRFLHPKEVDPSLPEPLAGVIMKALRENPDQRYQWAGEMGADLERYLISQGDLVTAQDVEDYMTAMTGGSRVVEAEALALQAAGGGSPSPVLEGTRAAPPSDPAKTRMQSRSRPAVERKARVGEERTRMGNRTLVGPSEPEPPLPVPSDRTERAPAYGGGAARPQVTSDRTVIYDDVPAARTETPGHRHRVPEPDGPPSYFDNHPQAVRRPREERGAPEGRLGEETYVRDLPALRRSGLPAAAVLMLSLALLIVAVGIAVAVRRSRSANLPVQVVEVGMPPPPQAPGEVEPPPLHLPMPPPPVRPPPRKGLDGEPERPVTATRPPPREVAEGDPPPRPVTAPRPPPRKPEGETAVSAVPPPAPQVELQPPKTRAPPRPPPVPAEPEEVAFMTLRSNHPAEILLDGKSIGQAPKTRFKVAAGRHEVRFDCIYDWGKAKGPVKALYLVPDAEADMEHECVEVNASTAKTD